MRWGKNDLNQLTTHTLIIIRASQPRFTKGLGSFAFFLGIEVLWGSTRHGTCMEQAKSCPTLAIMGLQLSRSTGPKLNNEKLYHNTVGALWYITITRLEVSYIVNKLSRFLHCPTDMYRKACKWVLRCLHGSIDHGLHIQSASGFSLTSFSYADWIRCVDDPRSANGFYVFLHYKKKRE